MQSRQFDDQDELLDVLSVSVQRQQTMASQIGAETEEQLELLDRLDDRTSSSRLRVERENRRISEFSYRSSTCRLWLVVLLLLIILCVVIVLAVYLPPSNGIAATTTSASVGTNTSATTVAPRKF